MPCSPSRILVRFAAGLSLGMGLSLSVMAQTGGGSALQGDVAIHARAASSTVTSPNGGSYSVDTGQWSGSSGIVVVTYQHFTLPNGWVYDGTWRYNGSQRKHHFRCQLKNPISQSKITFIKVDYYECQFNYRGT